MTTPATPTPRKKYKRPTKFPARLSTMLRQDQRDAIDARLTIGHETLGEVTRDLIDDGFVLNEAHFSDPELRADVEKLAREAGATYAEAIATMLRFAVRESARRVERNARIASSLATSLSEAGVPFDGIEVGTASISLE